MRTTITIDDELLTEVKRRAAESGSTVSRIIGNALRLTLSRSSEERGERPTFELVTYGRGGRFSTHNLDKASALLEMEDLERFGRKER